MSPLAYDSLPEPGERFKLGELLGTGVWANVRFNCHFEGATTDWIIDVPFPIPNCVQVYLADDVHDNRKVAIKIQTYIEEHRTIIEEEFRVLRDFSSHPNLLNFYGVYRNRNSAKANEIWFILEVSVQ